MLPPSLSNTQLSFLLAAGSRLLTNAPSALLLSQPQTALDFLSSDPERLLTVTHNQDMRSSELLEMTSREMGLSAEQYLVRLRDPKEWGGGLEIVALANALERPIFLYELKPVGILFWSR